MTLSFTPNALKTIPKQTELLAKHYPEGRVWVGKNDPNDPMGKLIKGLSAEFLRTLEFTDKLADELNLNKTIDLIERCETSVASNDQPVREAIERESVAAQHIAP